MICLQAYTVGDVVGTLPCGHHFHNVCIRRWLHLKGNCPHCRDELHGGGMGGCGSGGGGAGPSGSAGGIGDGYFGDGSGGEGGGAAGGAVMVAA